VACVLYLRQVYNIYKTIRSRLAGRSIGRDTHARIRDDLNTKPRELYIGVIFPHRKVCIIEYNTRRGTLGRGDALPREPLQLRIIPALS